MSLLLNVADPGPGPDEVALHRVDVDRVLAAVARLEPWQLRYLNCMEPGDAGRYAEAHGCAPSFVGRVRRDIVAMLREAMQ